jgi:hypothetical protein
MAIFDSDKEREAVKAVLIELIREDPVLAERIRGFVERNGGLYANDQVRGECPPILSL